MVVRIECLKHNCCECCMETEMQLSDKDVKRLEKIGFKRDEFSTVIDGVRVLRNVDGKCFFLKNGKCSVYRQRPLGCRLYPVVYDVDEGKAVIHSFCPYRHEIKKSTVKKVERVLIRHITEVFGYLP